jgi:hypothetical protein
MNEGSSKDGRRIIEGWTYDIRLRYGLDMTQIRRSQGASEAIVPLTLSHALKGVAIQYNP